uniref:RNA-dependent RNA polymerase n=1 Tax=Austropuccinia psidii associated ssRNA virus 1 TaxID=3180356 RepID=A0AAU7YQG5_9VIRU
MENSTVKSLTQRMVDGASTEYATPYSGAYDTLDKALGDELDRMVATSRSESSKKHVMLVTEDVSNDTLCLLERAFPAYTKIHHILHTTSAGDVEAMRSCLVHDLFQREAKNLKSIHVGGYADMHVPYGRSVHLETPAMTIMEISRGMRRDSNLEQLFRDYGNLFSKMPKGHMSWEAFYEFESRHPNSRCSMPAKCVKEAEYMLFDVNMIPMCVEQVCASMFQHNCEIADVIVLVENGSMHLGRGYIPGSTVMATYDEGTGDIEYTTDDGIGAEFPNVSRNLLLEWLTTVGRHYCGKTFTLEISQYFGAFVRISVTMIDGIKNMTVKHRVWDMNSKGAEKMRVVRVPKLINEHMDPMSERSYTDYTAVIAEKTYEAARDYAFALKGTDFTRANIRKKINEVNNRVIVKGTSVTIKEVLSPDVVEAVSMEIYLKTFVQNYEASQTASRVMKDQNSMVSFHTSSIWRHLWYASYSTGVRLWEDGTGDAIRALHDKLTAIIQHRTANASTDSHVKPLYEEHTAVLVHPEGGYWRRIVATAAGSALMFMRGLADHHRPNASRRYEVESLPDTSRPSEGFVDVELESEDLDYAHLTVCQQETEEFIDPHSAHEDVLATADKALIRTDAGAEDQQALLYYEECQATMEQVPDDSSRMREEMTVDSAVVSLNELYANTFPQVAAADMSADYDLAAHQGMDFVVNVPYLRMPMDNIVGSYRDVFQSRLNGPNRPTAPTNRCNLLVGVVKRNADPNVLKEPQPFNISDAIIEKFLETRCKPNARQMLADYQANRIDVSMQNWLRWGQRTDGKKVARVLKMLEDCDDFLSERNLSEFNLQFKGKVKPTVNAGAARSFAKFQTIMHYDTDVNAFFSSMFSDLTLRYTALLKETIHVGVRGSDADKRDFLRLHHPWNAKNLTYVQLDMSEYDKSQEIRAREVFDKMHYLLGLTEDNVKRWSHGQHYNVARCMALGIKLVVPLQMKSGVGTTLWGNTMYAQMMAAWMMPKFLYEMGQGDDLYTVMDSADYKPISMVRVAAGVFNMPMKIISQACIATRIGYFCGKFVVYDERRKEIHLLPDPVKAMESLSRPLTTDEAKFDEIYTSYQDRVAAWKTNFNTIQFDRMVASWYEASDLRATRMVDALISLGKNKKDFRKIWCETPTKVL